MAKASVTEELPASADEAWARLEDFGDMSAWAPDAKVVESTGSGAGAVRHVDAGDGHYVERCESFDAEARRFEYRLLESPHPYDSYLGEVTLTPIDDDRCRIEWKSEFEIQGVPIKAVIKAVEDTYRDIFIGELRKTLEAQGGT